MNPPMSALRSTTVTDQPARANSAAATRPLMPLPTTIASATSVISSTPLKGRTWGIHSARIWGVGGHAHARAVGDAVAAGDGHGGPPEGAAGSCRGLQDDLAGG